MEIINIKLPARLLLTACLIVGLFCWITPVKAQTATPGKPVYIYFFWGDGCPHCAKAKPYFEGLQAAYPGVIVKEFEVYYNEENQQLFSAMAQKFGLDRLAVPTIFIGSNYLQGYAETLNPNIEAYIINCLQNGCIDPGEGIIGVTVEVTPAETSQISETTTPPPFKSSTPVQVAAPVNPIATPGILNQSQEMMIPFLGLVNLDKQSAVISTAMIALIDGFNPCSLWVLTMLLALTLHTGSRKKVLIIGLIFLTVTAGIYALFIVGLFSIIKFAGFLGWVRIIVALIALFFALVNIKDYFWYKEGISFTIADNHKSGIFKRMRVVTDASQSFWGLVGATTVLAAGVSMVEFSCTAGFPVIWVNMLTAQNVSGAAFFILLLLYMLIYQFDELIIFFTAVITLKASRLEERHGRILKLISGMLMLALSIVMLVDPSLMNDLSSSLIIFGLAFTATLIVLIIHRILLPKFGIKIGSEYSESRKASQHSR